MGFALSKYPYFNRAYVVSSGFGCRYLYNILCQIFLFKKIFNDFFSFSAVVKPYEPPGLGKPSRVTPVGLDEDPDALSQDSLLESDSVEVLSVIRFNKSKLGSSTGTSDKRSSSSDTNSLFNNTNLPCPACDAASAASAAAAHHAAQGIYIN